MKSPAFPLTRPPVARTAALSAAMALLAGCSSSGELVVDQGVGVTALRTACPAVGVPDYTGNITTFSRSGATTADAIDVTANITNLRATCDEATGDRVVSNATFDVFARRSDTSGARTVTLPYFVTVLRGGTAVESKRVGQVTLQFADGQDRAYTTATGSAYINRSEATLPDDIRQQITRRRRPGEADAARDPLADPAVRAALARASFEMLVGFNLSEQQLSYNATR